MIIPNYYQHFCPGKIIAGYDSLKCLPDEMRRLGCTTAMVVTDKGVAGVGLIKYIEEAFKGVKDCKIAQVFDEAPPDSSNRIADKLAKQFVAKGCDIFIAVGGGSAMDTAKGANIVISANSDDLLSLQGAENIDFDILPMIAVPTTSGTGSEVTRAAIIYNEDKQVKMLFGADKLYPDVAVLDPRMTATVPPKITAATGMDAMTHAIEAYIDLQKSPIDDAYAKEAISLIAKYLVRATEKGAEDLEARLGMANAATMAGIAFSNAMVGAVHATAHSCGAVCHVPHGIANSILLPWCLEFNMGKVAPYIAELAPLLGAEPTCLDVEEQAHVTVQLIRNMAQKLNEISGMPLRLRDAGVTEDKLPLIARTSINDGCTFYNPEEMTYEDALGILTRAF